MSIDSSIPSDASDGKSYNLGADSGIPAREEAENLAPLARTPRTRRRARSQRGLPTDDALARLARHYLEIQRKFWPGLVNAGVLAPPTDELIADMVEDFKARHQFGKVDHDLLKPICDLVRCLAGMYARYSCENSSDLSIDDQMAKILPKAFADGCFIPWSYVYCDYSVTGRDASRQGYTSYKAALEAKDSKITVTYIDDFSRASRDEIEWWRLAALSKRWGKGLIGASDGFDLSNPNSDIMITVYGLLSRLFLKGLREKVKRGMHGAAGRGTCLGKPSFGFTRQILRNQAGVPVIDSEGVPTHDICIDPATSGHRLRMFEMFVNKRMSAFEIARQFNAESIDGWNGWTDSGIKSLLRNPNAIGVFIWNKTRREFEVEEEKWKVRRNPRAEWTVNYRPELALVPLDLWRAARRKLAEIRRKSPLTGRKPSRNQISATTLFSGTLICESCGGELKLIRSTDKYKQMGCTNMLTRGHNCEMSTSKSVKVIEDCLLSYLRNVLLTDVTIEQIVNRANAVLDEESGKAVVDVGPLKAKERALSLKITKLIHLIEDSDDKSLTSGYSKRIKELERELHGIKVTLRDVNISNTRRPRPLEIDQAKLYLENLRALLNRDTAEAAAAIRSITGPISVREEKISGRKHGARWIASFHPQWNAILGILANRGAGSPVDGLGTVSEKVEVPIEKIPQYEILAEKFKQLDAQGSSIASIASAHGISWQYASEILQFAKTGERPKWKSGKRTGTGNRSKYIKIAQQVIDLRDQHVSFARIAAQLKVNSGTVRRAYDYARPEPVQNAAENSTRVVRGGFKRLPPEKFDAIRHQIASGKADQEIAEDVGCSRSTVRRVRHQLAGESDRKAG